MNRVKVRDCWIIGDIGYIPLTQGKIAVVDAYRLPEVSKWNWYAYFDPSMSGFYATRNIQIGRERFGLKLHRFLLSVTNPEIIVDHINRDTLDNRMINLRTCSAAESARNQGRRKDNTTGVKGVHLDKKMGKYVAYISRDYKRIHLGTFDCLDDAREARRMAALEIHQQFACLG